MMLMQHFSLYFRSRMQAFTLPTVVIASLAMLSLLLMALQISGAISDNLRSQYYQRLANAAAESGIKRANECLADSGNVQTWTTAKPLTAGTDCNGNDLSSCPTGPACYVVYTDNSRSNFKVGNVTFGTANGYSVSVIGSVDLVSSGSVVSGNVASATSSYLSGATAQPQISGGAGWQESGHIGMFISTKGELFGYGWNGNAQLNNTSNPATISTPVQVSLPTGVTTVKKVDTSGRGASFICIIGNNDSAYCRGDQGGGLGFTGDLNGWTKVNVGTNKVYDIVVNGYGSDSLCVLAGTSATSTQAYCAGMNNFSQLGDGTMTNRPMSSPVKFVLPTGLTAKSVANKSINVCVIASDDNLYCAGRSDYGQIAGTVRCFGCAALPVKYNIPSMGSIQRKVKDVVMPYHGGEEFNIFAITTDGTIWASGVRNTMTFVSPSTRSMFGTGNTNGYTGTGAAELWGTAPATTDVQWATGGKIQAEGSWLTDKACIYPKSNSIANGVGIELNISCDDRGAQRWIYTNDTQAIMLAGEGGANTGLCLDLTDNNTANSTPLRLWTCNGSAAQRWQYDYNTHEIKHINSGKCISRRGSGNTTGTIIHLFDCNNASTGAQRFAPDSRTAPWQQIIAMEYTLCGVREESQYSGVWCAGSNMYGQFANVGTALGGGVHGGQCTDPSAAGAINMNIAPNVKIDLSKFSKGWQYQHESLLIIGTDGNVYGGGRNEFGKLGTGSLGNSANKYRQCQSIKMKLPAGVKAVDLSTLDEYSTYVLGDDGNVYATGRNDNGQLGDDSTINRLIPRKVLLPQQGVYY